MVTRIQAIFIGVLISALPATSTLVHAMGNGMGASGTVGNMSSSGMMDSSSSMGNAMSSGMSASGAAGNMGQSGMMDASGNLGQVRSTGGQVFQPGWNLAGHTNTTAISIATTFGSNASPVQGVTANLQTLWKWDTARAGWQFYAPSLDSAALASYAASKGYGVLTTINPGEGYWVNAVSSFSIIDQTGGPFAPPPNPGAALGGSDPFVLTNANLVKGWNLVATGLTMHPRELNASIGSVPPAPGESMQSFQTLWAWDNATNRWMFYAPSLDDGGTGMMDYIRSNGYLDFAAGSKMLGRGVGFWVNMP